MRLCGIFEAYFCLLCSQHHCKRRSSFLVIQTRRREMYEHVQCGFFLNIREIKVAYSTRARLSRK